MAETPPSYEVSMAMLDYAVEPEEIRRAGILALKALVRDFIAALTTEEGSSK